MTIRRCPACVLTLIMLVLVAAGAGCHSAAQSASGGVGPVYSHAVVATDHPVASAAGLAMLRRGGNAVDAAVAASFCLSVVRPYSCGIGGGGFMVIHDPGADPADDAPTQRVINYRETAPAAVGRDYYADLDVPGASRSGPHAVGVPGTVAGLVRALEKHGTLDLPAVLEPAIRAATVGFDADASFVSAARTLGERLDEHPELRPAADYAWRQLCRNGALAIGDRITNPEQARALRLLARDGVEAFYRGPIAEAIVAAMRAGDGPITHEDLAGYRVAEGAPLRGRYGRYQVLSIPPPSSGGIAMQQIFGVLERRGIRPGGGRTPAGREDPDYVHEVVEAMKHAFADRAEWLADPAFVDVPTTRLLDRAYLDELAGRIEAARTLDTYAYGSVTPAPADRGTSHISVLDRDGMAVACTETINLVFGSMVCVPGFGFVLNDEMDDFTTIAGAPNAFGLRQSDRNLPEPGKRPLSSMSPTIVLDGGEAVLVAGASGGPRIITGTTQCILACLLFDATPLAAVRTPRFHHQWIPDALRFEEAWTNDATVRDLESRGHRTERIESVGVVQIIRAGPDGIRAASDPRKGGRPAGY